MFSLMKCHVVHLKLTECSMCAYIKYETCAKLLNYTGLIFLKFSMAVHL